MTHPPPNRSTAPSSSAANIVLSPSENHQLDDDVATVSAGRLRAQMLLEFQLPGRLKGRRRHDPVPPRFQSAQSPLLLLLRGLLQIGGALHWTLYNS
uniref:Uncharacterized protein n=1 Tax=Caenorhabditis japonica TaxID=281687 RepID=A0A8R1IWG8_CAEJA